MKSRILVIGGLAAGPSAASKAKRVNPNADVTLFERGEYISYGICEIPYYISNVVNNPDNLISYTPQKLEQVKGVKVKTLHSVEEIVPGKKKILVRDLNKDKVAEYPYDKLVIATGSHPRTLGFKGEEGRNVFHVKSLEQGYSIKRFIEQEKPARAAIIGGGYIGMEMAEALVKNNIQTTLLHRGELPMSGMELLSREAVKGSLESHSVRFVPNVKVRELRTDQTGKVIEVLANTGSYPVDMLILSLGVEPNSELAIQAKIHVGERKGILTDQRQATNIDTIFAAGDCCEMKNLVNNRWMYIPLATTASKQGWVAGENAAGGSAIFKGVIRAIAVQVFDLEVAQVGISSAEAENSGMTPVTEHIVGNSKIGFFPGNEKVHIVLIADKKSGRLVGANVFGKGGATLRANTLGAAIQQRLTIDEVSQLDLIYSPPYAPLWDPILVAANQMKKKISKR